MIYARDGDGEKSLFKRVRIPKQGKKLERMFIRWCNPQKSEKFKMIFIAGTTRYKK